MTALLLLLGLVLLVVGAEALVRGASKLAAAVGISPLVIGLTVVAYGTSMPEMVVSVTSGLAGTADIAVGNVVGSNIFNVLLILGVSALITPLLVAQQLVRLDVPLMIGVSVLAFVFGLDGRIGQLEGLILFGGAIAYTAFLIGMSRRESASVREEYAQEFGIPPEKAKGWKAWAVNMGMLLGGLGLLVLGAQWLVQGAVSIAQFFGVSELIIGLTIVAGGTSLPEVATSVVASIRGERDIAVGNVVGSNIFNLLAVLGAASVVTPNGIAVSESAMRFDIPIMIAVAIACLPVFFTGNMISRWEGGVFLVYYIAYTTYLVLASTSHAALTVFSQAMFWFVIPLTALTLIFVTIRALRSRTPEPPEKGVGV